MKKCVICNNAFMQNKNKYYCDECDKKIKIVKSLEMVDKAEKLINKKPRNLRRIIDTVDVSENVELIKERIINGVDKFSSVPEVAVAIQMQKIGLYYETQKEIDGKKVDFYLPTIKIILEIDGEIYHSEENKKFIRDRQIMSALGEKWEIVHISSSDVPRYTWNLKEALPFVVLERNEKFRFRDSRMDSDFLHDFKYLEFYLKERGKNDNKNIFRSN